MGQLQFHIAHNLEFQDRHMNHRFEYGGQSHPRKDSRLKILHCRQSAHSAGSDHQSIAFDILRVLV